MMIENKEQQQNRPKHDGVLGRLVDESGELKEPSQCIIQYGGRVRLPDKLIEILNKEFEPESMWWQPDGECFAFDSETVQKKILDVWFRGTKLTSFIRSLNRWGFRRVFYHALPESALAFHHAAFRKTSTPEMLKSMKMSKSGKASGAIVGQQGSMGASLPAPVLSETLASPVPGTTQGLSALSQLVAAAPLSPNTMAASLLPQLPLTNTSSAVSVLEQQQQQETKLLKLLSEQRNRDLLTLTASTGRRASLVSSDAATSSPAAATTTSTLQRALLSEHQQRTLQEQQQERNQQLLLLARTRTLAAGQDLLRVQQEEAQRRQQNESALQLALLALKAHQNQSLL